MGSRLGSKDPALATIPAGDVVKPGTGIAPVPTARRSLTVTRSLRGSQESRPMPLAWGTTRLVSNLLLIRDGATLTSDAARITSGDVTGRGATSCRRFHHGGVR